MSSSYHFLRVENQQDETESTETEDPTPLQDQPGTVDGHVTAVQAASTARSRRRSSASRHRGSVVSASERPAGGGGREGDGGPDGIDLEEVKRAAEDQLRMLQDVDDNVELNAVENELVYFPALVVCCL